MDDVPQHDHPHGRPHGPLPIRTIPDGLRDPTYAHFAWARFRHLLAWMTVAAAICAAATIVALARLQGPLHLATMLAILGGVGGSVMMAGALMGLIFLSSGSGHDEDVRRID